ncbi:hypothetical protein HPB47_009002 [Ixodes persulcatus]|uniref:Uncharacterized protein n=1 Tax=Ixodes persulcatus TaxID=34615 RepID=A0AC60P368_IXOPE|nr:hypothetical protein HPB47_009002 [Ixodes persulcatus]
MPPASPLSDNRAAAAIHREVSRGNEALVTFPRRKPDSSEKVSSSLHGTHRVVQKTSPVNYLVQLLKPPTDDRNPDVVHVTRMKLYSRHEHARRAQEARASQS